jgi:hypothetical protein
MPRAGRPVLWRGPHRTRFVSMVTEVQEVSCHRGCWLGILAGMASTAVLVIEHRFARCPRGHLIRARHVTISWYPCDCLIAAEHAAGSGGPPGHHTVRCWDCHGEQFETVRYQPPHVPGHRPWYSRSRTQG